MEKYEGDFPFRKLKNDTYLLLDVLMYIKLEELLRFMFGVNNKARNFIQHKYFAILNGFTNDGLITHYL